MDQELYELVGDIYELSKHKHLKCTFDLECKLYARILGVHLQYFYEILDERGQTLRRLPKDILDTVEDMRKFALGHMNKETKKLLWAFLEGQER